MLSQLSYSPTSDSNYRWATGLSKGWLAVASRTVAGRFGGLRGRGILRRLGPEWRNWYTQGTQNPPASRSCGFESRLRHHPSPIILLLFRTVVKVARERVESSCV